MSPAAEAGMPASLSISSTIPGTEIFVMSILPPFNTLPSILSATLFPVDTVIGPFWLVKIPPPALGLARTKPPGPVCIHGGVPPPIV